jgi:hypothetical protein
VRLKRLLLVAGAIALMIAGLVAWFVLRPVPALGGLYFGESKASLQGKLEHSTYFLVNGPLPMLKIGGESYLVLLTTANDQLVNVRLVCLEQGSIRVANGRLAAIRTFFAAEHGEPDFIGPAQAEGTPVVGQKVFLEWHLRSKRKLIRVWQSDSLYIDIERLPVFASFASRDGSS